MTMRSAITALMGAMLAVFWSHAALAQPAACLADGSCETAEYCRKPDIPTLKGYWALALSWQPAFCETHGKNGCPEAAKAVEIEQTRVIRPDGNKIHYLTGLRFWLKPVNDKLTLSKGNFVTVEANWQTLGGRKARPMCAEPLTHSVYIDKPEPGQ